MPPSTCRRRCRRGGRRDMGCGSGGGLRRRAGDHPGRRRPGRFRSVPHGRRWGRRRRRGRSRRGRGGGRAGGNDFTASWRGPGSRRGGRRQGREGRRGRAGSSRGRGNAGLHRPVVFRIPAGGDALQTIRVALAGKDVGIHELILRADHTPFAGDNVSVDPGLRSVRERPAVQVEAKVVHLAGRLPLQRNPVLLRGCGEGCQGNCRKSREHHQKQEDHRHQQPTESAPQEGVNPVPERNPSLPEAALRQPRHRLAVPANLSNPTYEGRRGPRRIEIATGIPLGDEKDPAILPRCPTQVAMCYEAPFPSQKHDVPRLERCNTDRIHNDPVAGAEHGVHAMAANGQHDLSIHFLKCRLNSAEVPGVHSSPPTYLGIARKLNRQPDPTRKLYPTATILARRRPKEEFEAISGGSTSPQSPPAALPSSINPNGRETSRFKRPRTHSKRF